MRDPIKTRQSDIATITTLDGSLIKELMQPASHGNRLQSLAQACVPAGITTLLHRHHVTEELYHITSGTGLMTLAEEQFTVSVGDTICIPAGTAHCIKNTGMDELVFLCCCSPAYSDNDTELL